MRPPVDLGPCTVKGAVVASRARVMWENGVLYVARSLSDVVQVACPVAPSRDRNTAPFRATTSAGQVTFRKAGCTCSFKLGSLDAARLFDVAVSAA